MAESPVRLATSQAPAQNDVLGVLEPEHDEVEIVDPPHSGNASDLDSDVIMDVDDSAKRNCGYSDTRCANVFAPLGHSSDENSSSPGRPVFMDSPYQSSAIIMGSDTSSDVASDEDEHMGAHLEMDVQLADGIYPFF